MTSDRLTGRAAIVTGAGHPVRPNTGHAGHSGGVDHSDETIDSAVVWGEPAEIAATVAFLVSNDAGFVNGAVLAANGASCYF